MRVLASCRKELKSEDSRLVYRDARCTGSTGLSAVQAQPEARGRLGKCERPLVWGPGFMGWVTSQHDKWEEHSVFKKGWAFPATGAPPTFWPFMVEVPAGMSFRCEYITMSSLYIYILQYR